MKKVFIKYNPYKLETGIVVDGRDLAQNSELAEKIVGDSRLQDWVEELPRILFNEYNDKVFEITFYGTSPDYDDLYYVSKKACEEDDMEITINRIDAEGIADKENSINTIFKKIQQGPFEELRSQSILKTFEQAQSSELEVCVVATMSAGKSTLINAMLGTKLMPSKEEACTAIITKIKDCSQKDVPFRAEVYNKDGKLLVNHKDLTYDTMVKLNDDKNVSTIEIFGNIPFASSTNMSLTLVDTPGPNSSNNPQHKKVQSEFLNGSSKALVLYIITGEFGTNDDNELLERITESMRVNGKQSKDRFIFVVNKLDNRTEDDGEMEPTLNGIRIYLKKHGIVNPNLFPISALSALNIRKMSNGENVSERMKKDTNNKIDLLNSEEILHLEKYANIPLSIRKGIDKQLKDTKAKWRGKENENPEEALIHTGVLSLEAAIQLYMQKYARTAKIRRLVETFKPKLNDIVNLGELEKDILKNQDQKGNIKAQIIAIRKKQASAEDAKKFTETVGAIVKRVTDSSKAAVDAIVFKFQEKVTKSILEFSGKKDLSVEQADGEIKKLEKFAMDLAADFEVSLDELIKKNLITTIEGLVESYKKKIASLTDEITQNNLAGIKIDPMSFMGGSFTVSNFTAKIEDKNVKDREEWVKNTDKKWYKPWTWAQESGYYRDIYKTVKYVNGDSMAREFFTPVQKGLIQNGDAALKYSETQSSQIVNIAKTEIKMLDEVLKKKLDELESYTTDEKKVEERLKELEKKQAWAKDIVKSVESILEI